MAKQPRADAGTLRVALVLSIVAGSAALLACAEDGGGLANVRPSMTLDPDAGSTLGFGEVVIGRSAAEPIIVRVGNVGDGKLLVNRVAIDGAGAAAFRVSSFPAVVFPGTRGEMYVRFEPLAKLDATATLHLYTNDPQRPEATLTLSGVAREPCALAISPPYASFKLGEIKSFTLSARNSQDCTITYLFTDETMFPFVDPPTLPFTVPAGGSVELRMQHSGPSRQPGVPIRQVLAKETEGSEVFASVEGEPPISGCLSAFPERIIYGQTSVGATATEAATVVNRCNRDAWVTSGIITLGVYYFEVDQRLFPMKVPANGSVDIPVTYLPFSQRGDDGVLTMTTNDVSNPRFQVELLGYAAVPKLTYFPSLLDFGTVVFKNPTGPSMASECASNSQFVQLYNEGDAPLTIRSLTLDPAGDAVFEVIDVLVDGAAVTDLRRPFAIPTGKDAKIILQFHPTRALPAAHVSALTIEHDAPSPAARVTLRGDGADDGATTDTFTQLTGPKVDILWVIDSSGSMSNKQALLVQNMSQFVGYADSVNADYQMVVTDTDGHSPNAGLFRQCFPYPRILRSGWGTEAEREDAFRCMFTVGIDGPSNEAGLAAALFGLERATSPDQDPVSNRNAGFVRPDANLAIVVVSDEDDQSDQSQRLMRDYFLSIHGATRPDRVKVHAIAGPVAGPCALGPTQAQPGDNYYWMTQQLGGLYLDICNEDWQPLLRNLGIDTFQPLAEWTLSQPADPGSLSVTVGGAAVPRGAVDGYTYNPSANTIRFHGSAVPTPGATISVGYTGLCRP